MPIDVPKLVEKSTKENLEQICLNALNTPGEHVIYIKTRVFSTQEVTEFDPYEISIVVAQLQKRGLFVDYGTVMDSKTCRDFIVIKRGPTILSVKAEKLNK